jgi:hypothetical protein
MDPQMDVMGWKTPEAFFPRRNVQQDVGCIDSRVYRVAIGFEQEWFLAQDE